MRLKLPNRRQLLDELALAEEECDRAVEGGLTDGRSDQVKKWCATVAHNLIRKYSEKEPTSGSSKAPFRYIASLLYGQVKPSQQKTPDLKRACDDILRVVRAAVQITAQNSSDL
jgi:hypothetical protein